MARRCTPTALMFVCFLTTVLVGLRAVGVAAAGGGSNAGSETLGRAVELVALMREKIAECAGTNPDSLVPLFVLGAGAAAVAAFTLYLLGLYFDRDPFLFKGGKMGKLEAQSIYTANKKRC
ncbi:unnamed protein product [Hapterophycus canaliculatus]